LTAAGAVLDMEGPDERGGPGVETVARAVFALLVLACFAAFFVTQRLKHTPTVIQRFELTPSFSPTGPAATREEHLSFKLVHADRVTVGIVDASEHAVATLVSNHPLPGYKQFSLRWNGRRGDAHGYRLLSSATGHVSLLPENRGQLAPPGEYRVRVTLLGEGRTLVLPRSFRLLATPVPG
jgi:hypothetical protein